jgi:hypothetical protein
MFAMSHAIQLVIKKVYLYDIVLIALILGLFICGACTPAESASEYTSEQVIAVARKHSPECRILVPGENGSP